MIKFRW